jgi:mRNA-degrading endonuclease RelE of RelBE toxin-antitoxin system
MKFKVDRSFEKDARHLPVQIQKQLKEIIGRIHLVESIHDLQVSKLEGAKNAYRIRLGD